MKRAIRWVGVGFTVAAAATMLLADLLLAAPASGKAFDGAAGWPAPAMTFIMVEPGDGSENSHNAPVRLD